MSRIGDLVANISLPGVHYARLGDVATFKRGTSITRKDTAEGSVPVIAGGRAPAYFHAEHNRAGETIAVAGSGAYAGFVSYWTEPVFVSDAFSVHPDLALLEPKFVYYFLASRQDQIHDMKAGGGVPHVHGKDLAPLRIPVPPVAVQYEVIRVLDSFRDLEAELETELEARRRQYDHYRDSLLSFEEESGVRWVSFGEVATIARGASPRPIQDYLTDAAAGVNWIKIGDVAPGGKYVTSTSQKIRPEGARKSRRVEPGDFVLSNSMSFGRPYIVKIDGCIHDGWLVIKDFRGTFLPDFLYHLLRTTRVYKEMAQRAGAGTVQNLNADIVKSLLLPAPPLAEQERIVTILDKFDTLVNDLSIGLPAELDARRKQYEHYRQRLLTFSEAA